MTGDAVRPAADAGARVQIFVPSYNRREYLSQALDSILAQTFTDFHAFVVDDASPDGAADVARQYAAAHPHRVTALVNTANHGVTYGMNLAFERMRDAEYIAVLADDDLWEPSKLQRQVEILDSNPSVGLVATEARVIGPDGRARAQRFSDLYGHHREHQSLAHRIFCHDNCLCASSVLVRSAGLRILDHRVPVDSASIDLYLWLIIASQYDVHWIPEPLTSYRISSTSYSAGRTLAMRRESFELRRDAYDRFEVVRGAVGGERGRRRFDGNLLWWAQAYLAEREYREYLWYAWQLGRRRSPRLMVLLALYSGKAVLRRSDRSGRIDENVHSTAEPE